MKTRGMALMLTNWKTNTVYIIWSESIQIEVNIHQGIRKVENTNTKVDSVLKSNDSGKD